MLSAVREDEIRTLQAERKQHGLVRDRAQRENGRRRRKPLELRSQVDVAALHLVGLRLVLGRQALHRIRNAAPGELEPVIDGKRIGAASVALTVEVFVEQDACVIAGEGAARPVRTVNTGRQTDDQQLRLRVAERRHRLRVIFGVRDTHRFQMLREARARAAARGERRDRCFRIPHGL